MGMEVNVVDAKISGEARTAQILCQTLLALLRQTQRFLGKLPADKTVKFTPRWRAEMQARAKALMADIIEQIGHAPLMGEKEGEGFARDDALDEMAHQIEESARAAREAESDLDDIKNEHEECDRERGRDDDFVIDGGPQRVRGRPDVRADPGGLLREGPGLVHPRSA